MNTPSFQEAHVSLVPVLQLRQKHQAALKEQKRGRRQKFLSGEAKVK
jgi:hypothetical protein